MRRVRINTGQIGLVFRNGEYKKMLSKGVYWLSLFEEVRRYDRAEIFDAPVELNILLSDTRLKDELIIVEVADHQIALKYEEGIFRGILIPGRYAYWTGVVNYRFVKADLSKIEIDEDINRELLKSSAMLSYVRIMQVAPFEKGVLFVDGKFERVLENGDYLFWNNSIPIDMLKADMREQYIELNGQEILTKDKAALRINFSAQYRVIYIEKALIENGDFQKQLYVLMQLALREFIGTLTLDELLERKKAVETFVLSTIAAQVKELGLAVSSCGIRDVILPGEVKEIMNKVLIAEKNAQASVIVRREETASTRSLLNSAKLMADNQMLFKLKEMEYVEKIAEKINSISLAGGTQVVDQLRDIFSR